MKRPTKQEILKALNSFDVGFRDFGFLSQHGKTSILCFDNSESGNGEREYLYLKFNNKFVFVEGGFQLRTYESKIKWFYEDYSSIGELIKDISEFTYKFAKSFKLELVRK